MTSSRSLSSIVLTSVHLTRNASLSKVLGESRYGTWDSIRLCYLALRLVSLSEFIQAAVFRAEFFNIFNHANFDNPTAANLSIGSLNFGRITTTAEPRLIQFALKFHF